MLLNQQTRETCLVRDGYFAGVEKSFADWMIELKHYDEQTIERFRGRRSDST
jgi:hypothetical protein